MNLNLVFEPKDGSDSVSWAESTAHLDETVQAGDNARCYHHRRGDQHPNYVYAGRQPGLSII